MARSQSDSDFLDDLMAMFKRVPWWAGPIWILATWLVLRFVLPFIFAVTLPDNPFAELSTLLSVKVAAPAAFLVCMAWLCALVLKWRDRHRLERQTNLDTIRSLTWHDFELLLAEAFRRQGYAVRTNPPGPDGGVDLTLTRHNETTLVQAKNWRTDRKVGVRTVRELFGVMHAARAQRAILVTSGTLSQPARQFASDNGIQIIKGDALTRMIADVQRSGNMQPTPQPEPRPQPQPVPTPRPTRQPQPAPIPTNAAPTCPACQSPMILRTARKGPNAGSQFWGCSGYPGCRVTAALTGSKTDLQRRSKYAP